MSEITYTYKPNALHMALATSFFVVCTPLLVHSAQTNTRGLVINGFINLAPQDAAWFYWALTVSSIALVLSGLHGIYLAFASRQKLVLGDSEMRIPKSRFSQTILTIRYADIQSIYQTTVYRQRLLKIKYGKGSITLASAMLPGKAFDKVCNLIAERVQLSRAFHNAPEGSENR